MQRGSKQHREAIARGHAQNRAVRDYLAVLEQDRRRGSNLDAGQLEARIGETQARIDEEDDPAKRVQLVQKRLDDEQRLVELGDEPDLAALEDGFVEVADDYSQRKGLTYTAWREVGVPAAVLKRTGIKRTRRTS